MPPARAWRSLLAQEVAKDARLAAQLLALTCATGIQDATTFATYRVFASKQTGNAIFLAFYASDPSLLGPRAIHNVVVCILAFILGGAAFAHFARRTRPRCRGWLAATNAVQTLLVLGAATLQLCGGSALAILACLSLASAGQICMATNTGFAEVNTAMITGTLMQLSTDPRLFHWNNAVRDRRLLSILSLLSGAFVGGLMQSWGAGAGAGLLVVGLLRGAVTASLLWNRGSTYELPRMEIGRGPDGLSMRSKALWAD
ncbi:hypothetical protein LTR53_000681 [Teratosphaeriaceae sp. CCFEE 6253]|nr:hypothetical protein LTR53_000681 [Teratosphaeriaceae sp. CCFEE 6253]